MTAYDKLGELGRERQWMRDIEAVLGWDQEVVMPDKAVFYRADQLSWLSALLHDKFVRPEVGDWLASAESDSSLLSDPHAAANVREWRREYDRAVKIPTYLVEKLSQAQTHAKASWSKARACSDFAQFAPDLKKLLALTREKCECLGYEDEPYDALVDEYEPGTTTKELTSVLRTLRDALIPVTERALRAPSFDRSRLDGHFPIAAQQAFNQEVASDLGFDFAAGRIDTAVHPFCSGMGPYDVRLTTRYDEADFFSSLFGVMHEAGHGLYEQGLPTERRGGPVGHAVSLGIHESQSRLWENHVGRSLEFWEKWFPRAVHHFPHLSGLKPHDIYLAVNQASLSRIRVEADEVTYDLHILLRFEIEQLLFTGQLEVEDIPAEWNRRFESYFGVPVRNDAEGCLQDIHWSMGGFGYFATYSLGNMNAAHLMQAALKEGGVAAGAAQADYAPLLQWLRTKVHAVGSLYSPTELIQQATGTPTDPSALIRHLELRYCR